MTVAEELREQLKSEGISSACCCNGACHTGPCPAHQNFLEEYRKRYAEALRAKYRRGT